RVIGFGAIRALAAAHDDLQRGRGRLRPAEIKAQADADARSGPAAVTARAGADRHAGPYAARAVGTAVDPALRHLEPVVALFGRQLGRAEQRHIRHRPGRADALVGPAETVAFDLLFGIALPVRPHLLAIGRKAGAGRQSQGRGCDRDDGEAFHARVSHARTAYGRAGLFRCEAEQGMKRLKPRLLTQRLEI